MSTVILDEDTAKYIDMFYTPTMTSYEFLKSFFAQLYKNKTFQISRDLSDFFYEMKRNPRYSEILLEVKFKSNGIFRYSNELEDDILTLQNMGLLGKKNPSFGIILIEYDDKIADETLNALSEQHRQLICEIAGAYTQEAEG